MWLKKMFVSVLSAVCLFAGLGITASAESISTFSIVDGIAPLYEIADIAYSELYIVGTTAECKSQASGDDTVKITVEQTLEKCSSFLWFRSWNGVDGASWTKTVNRSSISLVNTKSGLDGGTYRVKSVFTLTDKNGKTETITVYSDEKSV